MKPVRLAFLWHMHQPLYRLRDQSVCFMPWVRLHAIRSYYDMARILDEFPSVQMTFNYVPILLDQLEAYLNGASDTFMELARRPIEDCGEAERAFLFDHFFSANYKRMIGELPRFSALLDRRTTLHRAQQRDPWREFSDEDYRDLQVLFDLSWFGFKAREDFPELKELARKGSGFNAGDVQRIFEIELEIMKRIVPLYRAAQSRGQIEMSCSPYAHPILPLLVHSDAAKEAMPHAQLPTPFVHPEDADRQIREALASMEARFGVRPKGIWPSEGSVSQEAARILAKNGVSWIATDEEVLARSEREGDASPYRAWEVHDENRTLSMVFRDRQLSDRIGFSYSARDPNDAVRDFLGTLVSNCRHRDPEGNFVLVALDGENPWEHYPRAGAYFLRTLMKELSTSREIQTSTISGAIHDGMPRSRIRRVHAGSWIQASFSTWIGGPEKNRAWDVLGRSRREIGEVLQKPELPQEAKDQAWASVRAAEGSDWFWWLDGQFSSEYRTQFDEAFRGHLKQAYGSLGLPTPDFLNWFIPSAAVMNEGIAQEPFGCIEPTIDGYESDFFEWQGAQVISWRTLNPDSTMHRAWRPFQCLYLGFSESGTLLLRADPLRETGPGAFKNFEVEVTSHVNGSQQHVRLSIGPDGKMHSAERRTTDTPLSTTARAAAQKILEISIPGEDLGLQAGKTASLTIRCKTRTDEVTLRDIVVCAPDPRSLQAIERTP